MSKDCDRDHINIAIVRHLGQCDVVEDVAEVLSIYFLFLSGIMALLGAQKSHVGM